MAVVCLGVAAPISQAAAPAWKMLAVTGPTDVPPVQSETQRVAIEAEGGTFELTAGFRAKVVDQAYFGIVSTTEGSPVATIEGFEGAGTGFEVGSRVVGGGLPEGENFVESCSSDCSTSGSTVTFSIPASETTVGEYAVIYTRKLTVEEGGIPVGLEISSAEAGKIAPGTTVTSVDGSTITLSRPPASEYLLEEVISIAAQETTAPVAFDASGAELQGALDSLPLLGPGAVSVTGGPGGDGEHPYFLAFGGPLAGRAIPQVTADTTGLGGLHPAVNVFTTVPGGPGTGEISVNPANIGGLETSGEYTVEVGPLPGGIVTSGAARDPENVGWTCPGGSGEDSVTCTSATPVPSLSASGNIIVPIEVTSREDFEGSVPVTITGGGAGSDTVEMPIKVSSKPATSGVAAFWGGSFDADGNPEVQAGGHPYSAATFFMLNTVRLANGNVVTPGDPRNLLVDLPPGFSGDPLVTPRCPQAQLVPPSPPAKLSFACNEGSKIGGLEPALEALGSLRPSSKAPVYNDVPPRGSAAEFTSLIAFPFQSLLGSVRSSENFGIRISALSNPNFARIYGAFAALEGYPSGGAGKPFLSNATSCAENEREAPAVRLLTESWQQQGVLSPSASAALPAVTGCAALRFEPGFGLQPSVTEGSSGTGAAAVLHVPQGGLTDPTGLATPALRKAVVSLPAGMTLNPSSANGLQACSETQIGLITTVAELPNPIRFDEEAPVCPDGSKLGVVEVKSPLLEEELSGTIYLAEQEKNPFGSLLALYLAIESPRFGLEIKLAGKVGLDPSTGQLTATFDYTPQLAFEELKLSFRGGGARSELATPEVCGNYKTTGSLEPWSAPESGPSAQIEEGGFDVTTNCSSSAGARPFAPTFEAGTTGTQAGAYSPLVIKVARKDGEQELKSLDFTLPKGLLGKLAWIPYCSEASIKEAEGKSGRAEESSSSCPAASQIGTVETAAGVGSEPFHVGGKVYLSGPYKGAPLSSVVITPAVAGPFDLGDVVIRAPLFVDPETAEITAKSDPIPTILKGIPLKVSSVALDLDRPGFTLNPTSCNVMLSTASIAGSDGATAKLSSRFQVGGCKSLKFKPRLQLSLKGSTSHTGHPALKAVLTYPKQGAYANIRRAQVNLPHSEFIDQGNLDKTCTKPVLLQGKCPRRSIYGRATAWTPLLAEPIEGPVYLVGGYGYKLPALVAELNGQIRVVLKGKVDSGHNRGIRNTFEAVPDAPVSRFVLQLKGGSKYSLLENSENLCKKPQRAIARFTAQNGAVEQYKPLIANQCGKKQSDTQGH